MADRIRIISTLPTHLPAIARCHRAAFPHSLATALGQRYVGYIQFSTETL